jgi:uncharacterized HAD superfamily protein
MTIAFDADDVLVDHTPAINEWHNREYGTNHTIDDYTQFELWGVWGCSREEAIGKVMLFMDSDDGRYMPAAPGAQDAVKYLGQLDDLVVITGRREEFRESTNELLKTHFSNAFNGIYLSNNYASNNKPDIRKWKIAKQHGADIIIEDKLIEAEECAEYGMLVLLMDKPWNQTEELPDNIVRVQNWGEAIERINEHYETKALAQLEDIKHYREKST